MGKSCVAGCSDINIDEKNQVFTVNGTVIKVGDYITLDGSTGRVINGKAPLIQAELSGDFAEIISWADEVRRLKVRTNADTPHDALVARDFGAQGIGLCRTEHMFFDKERISLFRKMIISDDVDVRREAIKRLLPIQRSDFSEIFKIMEGLPVTIRLLDPPLHEFLPHSAPEIKILGQENENFPNCAEKEN